MTRRTCKLKAISRTGDELVISISTRLNQTNSPLLKLPAEVREMIYEHMFYDSTYQCWDLSEDRSFALRQTCRQVRCEARSAFSSYTKFKFKNVWDIHSMICDVDEDIWSGMQSIELDYDTSWTFNLWDSRFWPLHNCKHIYVVGCPPPCGFDVTSLEYQVKYWFPQAEEVHLVSVTQEEYEEYERDMYQAGRGLEV
jgi:hypothetical protein